MNQLRTALKEYYPVALEAFEDWTKPSAWRFLETFPTPQKLQNAGKRKWQNFLHAAKLWRPDTAAKRLEIFARAGEFCGSAAQIAAKSLLAQSCVRVLQTLERQLVGYRATIEALFALHPDHDLFGSLPGAGPSWHAALGRDRRPAGAFCRSAKLTMPCGHRPGHDPVRADLQTSFASRL